MSMLGRDDPWSACWTGSSPLPACHAMHSARYMTECRLARYQNPLRACRSLKTVVLLLPICRIISSCLLMGCWANWASRCPSSTPRVRGRLMISFRTDLTVRKPLLIYN